MKLKMILMACSALLIIAGCHTSSENKKENLEVSQSIEKTIQPVPLKKELFNPNKAVEAVLKDHPEYPQAGEIKDIETVTGGETETTVKGKLTTSVEASSEPDSYIVTLTKQWDFSFNDNKLIGYWKYKVTPQTVQLVDTEENTDLLKSVK